ncbi:hypothetical protein Tco_1197561, partial [Tanacetum coccineum]
GKYATVVGYHSMSNDGGSDVCATKMRKMVYDDGPVGEPYVMM